MLDKKILVTGGKGFLGSHLIKQLESCEYKNITTFKSDFCDLTNQVDTNDLIYNRNPDIIIHLAATVGGIGANKDNPGQFCYENLVMGCNIIEAARQQCDKLEKFILISTTCCYPEITHIPFSENDIYNGYPEPTNAPYGIAKRTLMELVQSYRQQYGFPGITLIPTNLYGKGDSLNLTTNHVIPALISKVLKAKRDNTKVYIWGDGSPTRDFLYVDDCAKAIITAMEEYDKPAPVNLGTGIETSIIYLIERICEKLQYDPANIIYTDDMPNGQPRRCLDVSRVRNEFGWYSTTSLDEGLNKTIEWIKNEHNLS
jgi:nucleoside-diphosphate-sugar epimerase